MNVRLQYSLEFPAAIYLDDQLQLNQYQINLSMVTASKDRLAINIAMERLRVFVHSELGNAIFINQQLMDQAEIMQMMGMNMVTLPDDPVDQIIGLMLYCKLNAIMEGVMIVTSLDICSKLGDEVWYEHCEEDAVGPLSQDGWWHSPTTQHNSIPTLENETNVVKVAPNAWIEYDLGWPDNTVDKTENSSHTVVYAKFPRHEN